MTEQQSCVPWTSDALDRDVTMYANDFAAAGILIGITATLGA
jgi:hypothetical protein